LRPTFLGFEASKTAIFLNQKALDITGNNLSNVSTEGYTRQRVVQTSKYTDNTNVRYASTVKGALDGQGVDMKGVSQVRNERLDVSYRNQNKEVGYYEQKNDMLSNIETILQEFDDGKNGSGYAISNSIYEIYTSLEDFSNNPTSEADANVVASAFNGMAQTLNQLSKSLEEYAGQCRDELQINVDSLNNTFAKIAQLNDSIKTSVIANGYTDEYGPNELMDERNLLLDEISEYGDISVNQNIDGTVDVTFNGKKVIQDNKYESIHMQETSNGLVSLTWMSDGSYADTGTGKLKAYTDIINGAGVNAGAGQSSENGIVYYKEKLNNFASKMADVFNNIIPAEKDADGNVTSYVKIFGAYDGNGKVYPDMKCDASNISITTELEIDSSILIEDKNVANNTNILKMITSLTEDEYSFDDSTFTGTFSDFVNDYVGTLGSDVNYSSNRAEAVSNIATEILNSRDEISGVSESEETVNMMTFNRAFQAAARMMTVMDDLLDVLINNTAV
jgi:flagellar hook-associated protein 1 FlgK